MDDFKEQVRKSFQGCKTDIEALKIENSYLKSKILTVESENFNLKKEFQNLFALTADMKAEVKGMTIALNYIKEFNEKQHQNLTPSSVEISQSVSKPAIDVTVKNTPKQKPLIRDPYEALLAFKAKSNKREILKQKLISMIEENGMNLSELKFLFVEHFRYCSKATFYNYLKELELEKIINVKRENSKNFIYSTLMRKEV